MLFTLDFKENASVIMLSKRQKELLSFKLWLLIVLSCTGIVQTLSVERI